MGHTSPSAGKILIIDDDSVFLEILHTKLASMGFDVETTVDPVRVLKASVAEIEAYDVILSDLRMPSLDGTALLQFIKDQKISTPTIILTADDSVQTAVQLVKAGAFDYQTKPVDFDKLSVSVARAIRFIRLDRENRNLKNALAGDSGHDGELCPSESMKRIHQLVVRVAKSRANVLITGESGVGKEVIASKIHALGNRPAAPFVAINCSAIPETLLESELFGHAKGSFTGAIGKKIGLFEEANGGTLFLDEIGDLSLPLQAKLLRVLQDRKIKRVGENQYIDIDVALIAATHKNLEQEVRSGRFREDLYYRLNVIPIQIPPLRQRKEDILPLANHFLNRFSQRHEKKMAGISRAAKEHLLALPWYGNIRELENAIERAVVLAESDTVEMHDLPHETSKTRMVEDAAPAQQQHSQSLADNSITPLPRYGATSGVSSAPVAALPPAEWLSLHDYTLRYIEQVLEHCHGVKEKAAHLLDIDRKTLYRKIEEIQGRNAAAAALVTPIKRELHSV